MLRCPGKLQGCKKKLRIWLGRCASKVYECILDSFLLIKYSVFSSVSGCIYLYFTYPNRAVYFKALN